MFLRSPGLSQVFGGMVKENKEFQLHCSDLSDDGASQLLLWKYGWV